MITHIQKFDFIDALRGYAILLVLLVHSSQVVSPESNTLYQLMNGGARGVQLFFVASAITLCLSWHSRSALEISPVRNFFIRRFFRIAPMWFAAIAFYAYYVPHSYGWWYIPLTATFLHGFLPETINAVVPGGWSIAVEMSFYLVFPFLMRRVTSLKHAIYFLILTLVIYNISRLAIHHFLPSYYPATDKQLLSNFAFLNFLSQLPVFALGIIAYFLFTKGKDSLRKMVIAGNVIFAAVLMLPTYGFMDLITKHIDISAAFALLSLTLAVFPLKMLVNRLICEIGKISFSMYLSHFALLSFFSSSGLAANFDKGNLSSMLYFCCLVVTTALVSYVLYRTIERPGMALGKRIIRRLENRQPASNIETGPARFGKQSL